METLTDTNISGRVLMIDDDEKFCALLRDYLRSRGFTLDYVNSGIKGIEKIKTEDFQAVILDVMMPEIDGFEVLKQIRQISTLPVLMLTALGDESDRIVGLEIGADDYLPKTFSTRELLARLRAVIRRSQVVAGHIKLNPEKITVRDVYINAATREVLKNNVPVMLTSLEFDLLFTLIKSAGSIVSRDKLLDEAAGRNFDVFDRSIDVHVSSLRRKLDDDPKNPRYIKTVRSAGYMFLREDLAAGGDK